jgi:mono/diheme cytochrome c family protein
MQAPDRKPAVGVLYDSGGQSIDQVLALALLFGLEGRRQARVTSVSTSRHNLKVAAFLDLVCRFYGISQPIGMSDAGPEEKTAAPMLAAALEQTVYRRDIAKHNDTADPAAQIRNALSAQFDENAAVVLAGSPVNLLQVLAWPDGRQWIASKPRALAVAAGRFDNGAPDDMVKSDAAGFRKLLAEWPGPVVFAGAELNDALPFPSAALDKFSWTPNHPVADAYRAAQAMPYDAPSRAMAAMLHAVLPEENYFRLSEPGTVTVLDDGHTRFTPSPQGKHRYLILEDAQKARVLEAYLELASARPPQRGRGGPPKQEKAAPPKPAAAKPAANLLIAALATALLAALPFHSAGQSPATFETAVRPVLSGTCSACHNANLASGGLNAAALPSDPLADRPRWERVLRRVRAGEMPPPGVPRPTAEQLAAFTGFLEATFARADAATPIDPGRVVARRLNRNEYTNTIRDLLGVRFRAEKYFPTDDSGDGFDNIGDVLTVSPLLMERYLAAAEQIARWAVSTEIPPKPLEVMYHAKERRIRRIDRSTIEAEHRVEYAGDYIVRFGLPGERDKDAAPVTLGFWMNGALIETKQVETKPSGLVYFNPYSEEEIKVYLPEGDHVFRAGFIGDAFVNTLTDREAYDNKKNKFLDSMYFIGPMPSDIVKESRRKILVCDPASGRACVERIVATLARRAWRRAITRGETEALLRFFDLAVADGKAPDQGLELAIQAMLVSPHFLFRIERDPPGGEAHPVSEFELASRLSYFLWSSMPDDELLNLAESGRLRASLEAQVARMLADPRSAAFAENFAGQWLETRNLDVVKPDPEKFPAWDPELRDAMKQESALFFDYVLRQNRPISDFLSADYTFLNERLARHYGIEGVTGHEFRKVDLAGNPQRGGVLSQAGVLTVSSYPTRTSPVIRGKYVLQNILGAPPPPPPPDVPVLDEEAVGKVLSMREQLEKHRADATCASCHSKMDPLGFGLENYDAIGRWREQDGNFPVDASGVLPNGRTFSTPAEMRRILASQLPEFSRTLIEKVMTYALGRGLKPFDSRTVDNINEQLAADGYRFQTLIRLVVASPAFQSRRGETVAENRR